MKMPKDRAKVDLARIRRMAMSLGIDARILDDVVQEAASWLLANQTCDRTPGDLMKKVLLGAARKTRRALYDRREAVLPQNSDETAPLNPEADVAARQLLGKVCALIEEDCEGLASALCDGNDIKEFAEEQGTSHGAIRNKLYRTRKRAEFEALRSQACPRRRRMKRNKKKKNKRRG